MWAHQCSVEWLVWVDVWSVDSRVTGWVDVWLVDTYSAIHPEWTCMAIISVPSKLLKKHFTIAAEAITVHLVGLPSLSWSRSTFLHPAPQVGFADVISVLIATVKNSEEPGTFETVLNFLLIANGLRTFKMGNVTPPTSFPPTITQLTPHL